jgi:hypothetical protein
MQALWKACSHGSMRVRASERGRGVRRILSTTRSTGVPGTQTVYVYTARTLEVRPFCTPLLSLVPINSIQVHLPIAPRVSLTGSSAHAAPHSQTLQRESARAGSHLNPQSMPTKMYLRCISSIQQTSSSPASQQPSPRLQCPMTSRTL